MNMPRLASFAAIVLPAIAFAQTAPSALQFEVASVRPAPPMDQSVKIGVHTDGSQVRFDYLSLRDCMRIAWEVKDYQIVGPDWIASDRFIINAKVPEGGSSPDQRAEMLRNLLLDRFKLTVHKEKKEFQVYGLELAKGGFKMKESAPDGTEGAPAANGANVNAQGSAAGVFVNLGGGAYFTFADNKLVGHKLNMSRISDTLAAYMDKPVVDLTGVDDTKFYDFSYDITPDDYRVMLIRSAIRAGVTLPPEALRLADGPIDSLYSAMEASGLKMNPQKAPIDVIVVDKADKNPTEN
jgi:uncharacterized protein (TIGR03435 family)